METTVSSKKFLLRFFSFWQVFEEEVIEAEEALADFGKRSVTSVYLFK